MVRHAEWTNKLQEACEEETPVVILNKNVDDKYFLDLEVKVCDLKQTLTHTCKGKHVVFCSTSGGLTFATTESRECFNKTSKMQQVAHRGPVGDKAKPGDAEGRRILNEVRAPQQSRGFPDAGEMLCKARVALRQPGFAVVLLRAEKFLADQSSNHIVTDLFESWCGDADSVACGSVVIIVTANIERLPAAVSCQGNGRVAVIEIPMPDADEFSWILQWMNLRPRKAPIAREDDIPQIARAAAEANLMLSVFIKMTRKCERRDEQLTPASVRRHCGSNPFESVPAENILNLKERLDKHVIGQDEAKAAICDCLTDAKAGLADPDSPLGVFMFLGPTGVGKTELVKALARELYGGEDKILRIDMSEYMEKHTVARLTGSPPGYVGYEQGGQLTNPIAINPYRVVLLDEVEKAHSDVLNILLQVFDDGRLTDGQGRTVDFRNTVIIMTSNAGAGEAQDTPQELKNDAYKEALRGFLRPEFLNRVDEVIIFDQLEPDTVRKIAGMQVDRLGRQLLERRGVILSADDGVLDHIAAVGTDPEYNARPIKRAVKTELRHSLARLVLLDDPPPGTHITMTLENGEIKFSAELPLGDEKKGKKKGEKEQGKED